MRKMIGALVILSLVSGMTVSAATTDVTNNKLLVIYSNNVNGETEPCG